MRQTFFILIAALALTACQGSTGSGRDSAGSETQAVSTAPENLVSISFDVEGMTCTGCESTVERALISIEGVVEAEASHEAGKTLVRYDKTMVTAQAMEESIVSRGYKVNGHAAAE